MTKIPGRWLVASCSAILLLAGIFVFLVPSGENRYRAESGIMIYPYTNAVLSREFETAIIRAIPGVIRLRALPALSATPGSGVPVVTNGAAIQIFVVSATASEAQHLANQAAISLCATTRQIYAVKSEIAQKADRARPYSYFHDRFEPGIGRLFKK